MNQRDKDLEVAKLYTARANGETIQTLYSSGKWHDLNHTDSMICFGCRIQSKTRIINGFEVPDCLHKEPNTDYIFLEDLALISLAVEIDLKHTSPFDSTYKKGILHATKEGAIANCKARLGIDPYPNDEVIV